MSRHTLRLGLASLALLGLCGASVTSLASAALFTDTASTATTTVASGSVELTLGGTASTGLAVSAMAPGDARYAVVSVHNSGSLGARYAASATWSTGNALTSALELSVRSVDSATARCDASLPWGTGELATGTAAVGDALSVTLFGDVATGADTGDRELAASTSDHLCVRLLLPAAADNRVANKTSDLSLHFASEQTANNP